MERIINAALITVSMYVWVFKKYGILAMFTKKVAKHAAVGRAKHTWLGPVRSHRGLAMMTASDIVARLKLERARAGFALAA